MSLIKGPGSLGVPGGPTVSHIKLEKRSPTRSWIFGRSRKSVTRETYIKLHILSVIADQNLSPQSWIQELGLPRKGTASKKRCRIIICIQTFIFHYQLQVKIHSYLKSVFHFMITRSLGLAWKSLMKVSCFHKMKIVQTLF